MYLFFIKQNDENLDFLPTQNFTTKLHKIHMKNVFKSVLAFGICYNVKNFTP